MLSEYNTGVKILASGVKQKSKIDHRDECMYVCMCMYIFDRFVDNKNIPSCRPEMNGLHCNIKKTLLDELPQLGIPSLCLCCG